MSVESVMEGFVSSIQANYDKEIFEVVTYDPTPSDTGQEEGEDDTITSFDAKVVVDQVCDAINAAKESISKGWLYLFNDLEHPNGEHQNFLVLNAVSEVFRKTPSYDFNNPNVFTDRLEYCYTCGQLYTSYAKGVSGEFLDILYGAVPLDITEICEEYQELYDEFVPSTTPGDSSDPASRPMPKLMQFWNRYSNQFTAEILAYVPQFQELKSDWDWFYEEVSAYKDLGVSAAQKQAVGYVFVNTDDRTEQVHPTMTDVFQLCKGNFQVYDTLVEELYGIWLQADAHAEQLYAGEDEWTRNSNKLKVFSGVLLEHIGFFDDAKAMHEEFLTFFGRYNILS